MFFVAGFDAYQTLSNAVLTALRCTGPLIYPNPSTAVAPMVAGHWADVLGREVMMLDPTNPIMGFNVLDGIETSKQKEEDIVAVAHMLLSDSIRFESSSGAYFQSHAHNLLTELLAHVTLSPDYAGRRNLRSLLQIVSEPESSVLVMLRVSTFLRETLGVLNNMTEQTSSGAYSTASTDTPWPSPDSYAALVCSNKHA